MCEREYQRNRKRLSRIQGLPLDENHSCHHYVITRLDAKRNPQLKRQVDKLNNLFILSNEDHERVEELMKRGHIHAKLPRSR